MNGPSFQQVLALEIERAEWDILFDALSTDAVFFGTRRSRAETWALVVEARGGFS